MCIKNLKFLTSLLLIALFSCVVFDSALLAFDEESHLCDEASSDHDCLICNVCHINDMHLQNAADISYISPAAFSITSESTFHEGLFIHSIFHPPRTL